MIEAKKEPADAMANHGEVGSMSNLAGAGQGQQQPMLPIDDDDDDVLISSGDEYDLEDHGGSNSAIQPKKEIVNEGAFKTHTLLVAFHHEFI